MTLNSSGPISLGGSTTGQSVNLELGQSATAQISFNDAAVRTLTGTSSGSALVMPTNFYGKGGVVISVTDQTISDFTGGARSASTGYRLTSGGQADGLVNVTWSNLEQWCTPTSAASDYEVLATVVTGSLSSGTTGSWLALSSTQTWTRTASVGTSQFCSFTVQIRKIGTSTVLDSATINLEADATF